MEECLSCPEVAIKNRKLVLMAGLVDWSVVWGQQQEQQS